MPFGNINGWKHGKTGTPELSAWEHMMQRCYNPNCRAFKNYGGRGIIVCDRWHESVNFLEDMGPRPSSKHSLERKENNGNYEPDNCEWMLHKYQPRNRRTNKLSMANVREARRLWEHTGLTLGELARKFEVSRSHMSHVLNNGYWKEGK